MIITTSSSVASCSAVSTASYCTPQPPHHGDDNKQRYHCTRMHCCFGTRTVYATTVEWHEIPATKCETPIAHASDAPRLYEAGAAGASVECIPETQQISFLWIPGHAGIPENEKADDLAKEALNKPERLNVKYPVDDCKAILQQHIQQLRQKTWDELGPQHSHNIKPHLAHWSSSKQNCRQKEVLLTRLRTGRTRLNTPWLGTQQLNICSYCNSNTVPTVNHLLLECHHFDLTSTDATSLLTDGRRTYR